MNLTGLSAFLSKMTLHLFHIYVCTVSPYRMYAPDAYCLCTLCVTLGNQSINMHLLNTYCVTGLGNTKTQIKVSALKELIKGEDIYTYTHTYTSQHMQHLCDLEVQILPGLLICYFGQVISSLWVSVSSSIRWE